MHVSLQDPTGHATGLSKLNIWQICHKKHWIRVLNQKKWETFSISNTNFKATVEISLCYCWIEDQDDRAADVYVTITPTFTYGNSLPDLWFMHDSIIDRDWQLTSESLVPKCSFANVLKRSIVIYPWLFSSHTSNIVSNLNSPSMSVAMKLNCVQTNAWTQ